LPARSASPNNKARQFPRTLAIALKEMRHVWRDRRIFFLVTISPALMLVAFAYLFSFEIKHIRLAVLDNDLSPLSRQYVSALTADGELQVATYARSDEESYDLLTRGAADVGIIIPLGFQDRLTSRDEVAVQVLVDGSDAIAAIQGVGNLTSRSAAFSTALLLGPVRLPVMPIEVRSQVWYNPNLKSLVSMVPALIAIVLILPALAIALAMTREKEMGTFETLLATPLQGRQYILGKLLAYLAYGLLSSIVALAVAVLWFRVPFQGALWVFLLLTADYLLACLGFSLLVTHFVASQQAAMLIVLLIFFVPSFFLSGLVMPANTTSLGGSITSFILPTTHFVNVCRAVFLKGLGLGDLWLPALALAAMGGGTVLASILLFRKKIGRG
jgi:ABC-2 type transport system permease protein